MSQRTEYGKAVRRAYEAGEVQLHRNEIRRMVPRTDGIANTLTTVTKDTLIMEMQ